MSRFPRLFAFPILALFAALAMSCRDSTAKSQTLWMPKIFGDHMVLQRDMPVPIWGRAASNEKVEVVFAGHRVKGEADASGRWRLTLAPLPAGGPHQLAVSTASGARLAFSDILVGEVWLCAGQSNMQWSLNRTNFSELEIATSNHPQIRLITIPNRGSPDPQDDVNAKWAVCSPQTSGSFSAVGYLFGRRIHDALGVPVGLINAAWGGSAVEAWIPRKTLETHPQHAPLLEYWDARIAAYTDEEHARITAGRLAAIEAWKAGGQVGPPPPRPSDIRTGNSRPGNIFNGVLLPVLGYGIRGTIWYQGEANADRAEQYRDLFPLFIRTLRSEWGQGDFPFYWAQLADFLPEDSGEAGSAWAELREAQTLALDLEPNTAQSVTIDAGEGRDIHPRDKQTVANRLASIALARDHGLAIPWQSPRLASAEFRDGKAILTFNHAGEGLYAFDTDRIEGFFIAGEDRKFHPAAAEMISPNTIAASSEAVPHPVAVRYGWANNPVVNLYNKAGLPVTPFRTDTWPGITSGKFAPEKH